MEDRAKSFREFEARGWEEVAADYSASDVVQALTAEAARELVDAVDIGPGRKLLDLACGPGLASLEAVRRGATVTGLDVSEAMLKVARRACEAATFHHGRAEELPFEDAAFDAVICGFGLPHFADADGAFREVERVLARGGRIAFTTWCAPDKVRVPMPAVLIRGRKA